MSFTFKSRPPYPYLSAAIENSFAYRTVKDRMPVILTKVIDFLCRSKNEILKNSNSEVATLEDLKFIIGKISKLRSEMQTNKTLCQLETCSSSDLEDCERWNKELIESQESAAPCWFNSPWLLVECYMYRAIYAIFNNSTHFKRFDPFSQMKQETFLAQKNIICQLASYTNELCLQADHNSSSELKVNFIKLIEISLWSNRNDLSLSAGRTDTEVKSQNFFDDIRQLHSHILVNNVNEVWLHMKHIQNCTYDKELSIIMDNSGLEMVADLCLAVYCISYKLFDRVNFYVKKIPWFVSDTTFNDLKWALDYMKNDCTELQHFAEKCLAYLDSHQFQVLEERYFTLPLPYHVMKEENPKLYKSLCQSQLLIFKGDLNYRKLGGEVCWPSCTTFKIFLQGFNPAPLLALRTIKAEIICDVPSSKTQELDLLDTEWMVKGNYGLIQFSL